MFIHFFVPMLFVLSLVSYDRLLVGK